MIHEQMMLLLLTVSAYLLGSIPFGRILVLLFHGRDITSAGSGNVGATNVLRTAGPRLGVTTLLLDFMKGAVPVFLAGFLHHGSYSRESWMALVCLAAFLGHIYPVYSGFKKGGKGVATGFGAFVVIDPVAALLSLFVFLAGLSTRMVSVGSVAAAITLPIFLYLNSSATVSVVAATVVSFFIVVRHIPNLKRLIKGQERRIF